MNYDFEGNDKFMKSAEKFIKTTEKIVYKMFNTGKKLENQV